MAKRRRHYSPRKLLRGNQLRREREEHNHLATGGLLGQITASQAINARNLVRCGLWANLLSCEGTGKPEVNVAIAKS